MPSHTIPGGAGGVLAEWSLNYIGGADPAVMVPVGSGAFISLVEPDPELDYTESRYSLVSSGSGVTFEAGELVLGAGLWSVSFVGVLGGAAAFFAAEISVDDGEFVFEVAGDVADLIAGAWMGRIITEARLSLVGHHDEVTEQEVVSYMLSVLQLA